MKPKIIVFINLCNVGDSYLSEPFVRNIIKHNDNYSKYYIWQKYNTYQFTETLPVKNLELEDNLFLKNIILSNSDIDNTLFNYISNPCVYY